MPISVFRGDNHDINITVYESGVVKDITGWTVFFMVKANKTDLDAAAVISKTVTVHTNPTIGQTQVALTPTDTNLVGVYHFDIQTKDGSGKISTALVDTIEFKQDITIRTT